MVRKIPTSLRPAVAMIELIFALVIMAIVLMSAPMLISSATSSGYVAMQQEGINEASSRLNMIMGYPWDENNTDNTYIPILHVSQGHSDLNMVINQARRQGIPSQSQRTFIFDDANSSNLFANTVLGLDALNEVEDDIDDFIGDITLTAIDSASIDYSEKTTININTAVSYISDTLDTGDYNQNIITFTPFTQSITVNNSSNIKSITVTLTSTDTNNSDIFGKNIVLRAFSCNIGAYELEERNF
ncbi:MAG: type II secretion system protein [Sulfurovum sp.]|nr:type II secretion system protein [Sulfurovum sp.]